MSLPRIIYIVYHWFTV